MLRQRLGVGVAACVIAAIPASTVVARVAGPAAAGEESRRQLLRQERRPALPEPAAIAGQGYTRVFNDDFDRLDQCASGCRWSRRLWYEKPPPARSQYVRNSVLHLVSRRSQGYPNISITTLSDKGAAGRSFRGGYFEARMRWTRGNGAWPAFWLLSRANPLGRNGREALAAELDIFEGYAWAPTTFHGVLHRNTGGGFGVPDESRAIGAPVADLTAGFHTYAALWTPTEVVWYLDSVGLGRAPVFDSTEQDMFLILDMWIDRNAPVDATTPTELHLEVDYVRVWQGPREGRATARIDR
jgi:hypothetical protein